MFYFIPASVSLSIPYTHSAILGSHVIELVNKIGLLLMRLGTEEFSEIDEE